MLHRRRPLLVSTLVTVSLMASLGLSSCSSDGSDGAAPSKGSDPEATQPDGDRTLDGPDDDAASQPGGSAGGTARITVGDQTWEFDQVACAFGEEETGIEGAVFNMAASKDRISLYAADEPDRSYVELADLDEMDDGGLNWFTTDDPGFAVDGRTMSATFDVVHLNDDGSQDTATAQFEADCS